MSHRLTRKEMKRDEVLEGLARFVEFLRANGKQLGLGLVALLLAVAGFAAWKAVEASREERANLRLAEALSTVEESAGGNLEAARSALEAVVVDVGGTRAGAVAHVYLGTLAARGADYVSAREHWEAFLAKHSNDALAAQVERNLISLDRAEGRDEELVERLRGMLATESGALGADAVLWELGRTLEQLGQVEGAIETYSRLEEEYPASLYAGRARERNASLETS